MPDAIAHLYFGVVAVFIATALSIFQFYAESGYKVSFEGLLVGPDCAVAGAALSLHRIYTFFAEDGAVAIYSLSWWEKFSLGFSPLVLCIGVFLFTLDSRNEAIKHYQNIQARQYVARPGILGWLISTANRVMTTIQDVARLLGHSVPNIGVGGTAVFIAAVATVAKLT